MPFDFEPLREWKPQPSIIRPAYEPVSDFGVVGRKKMNHTDLIGSDLKSEFLNDLFETYDVSVIYEYDRTYENLPDQYNASIPDLGLEFIFDDQKTLKTLFIKMVAINSYNPFEKDEEKLRTFETKDEVLDFAGTHSFEYQHGGGEFMGERKEWVRIQKDGHSVHYEFVDSELKMITLERQSG